MSYPTALYRRRPRLRSIFCSKRCLLLFAAIVLGCAQEAGIARAQEAPALRTPTAAAPAALSQTAQIGAAATPTRVINADLNESRYRIGAGDVLDIRVLNRPQLSREAVRLDDRGTIQMPWIDKEIQAVCRTERELADELTSLYRRYLRNPQVDVYIRDYQSKPVAVIGAVNTPGRFQLQRRLRLLELLTYVNGPAERAGRTIQIVHADDSPSCESKAATPTSEDVADEESDVTSIALGDVLRGDRDANPYLRPGDTVTVLDADRVFVIGNVIRPTQIPLREPLTISQAVAMAGGLAPDAKSDKVRIVRQLPDAKKSIFFVDLKAIEKGTADDLALEANDIVNIPSSNTRAKQIGKTLLNSFFPSVGSLPVRVIPIR